MAELHALQRAFDGLDPATLSRLKEGTARFIEPMRAKLTRDRFSDPDWLFERKFDGVRLIVVRQDGKVTLFSRNRHVSNAPYPEIVDALETMGGHDVDFVLDGEVVALVDGQTSFSTLQRRMQKKDPRAARATGVDITFFAFDLLNIAGHDTVALPLRTRKRLLKALVPPGGRIRYTDHRDADGEAFYAEACDHGWEGLIAKRADAPYVSRRSGEWLKFKCEAGQEFVIGGYTEPQGTRVGFGALLVGYHDQGRLRYAGKVGTGFDTRLLTSLHGTLQEAEQEENPFDDAVPEPGAHFVEPALICEVAFTEWTEDGRLRHPRFKGLRDDKRPEAVTREA